MTLDALTVDEKAALAEAILTNPLWVAVMSKFEGDKLELCANLYITDEDRRYAAMYVQTIRNFRADCEAMLRNNQPRQVTTA